MRPKPSPVTVLRRSLRCDLLPLSMRCRWEFDGPTGNCVAIPQISEEVPIPERACVSPHLVAVREGIVYVWMEPGDGSDASPLPVSDADLDKLQQEGVPAIVNSFQMDLPYDASFLAENLLDPAHIEVSHDGTPGGGCKANAQPLEMELDEEPSAKGFRGRFRETRPRSNGELRNWTNLAFDAPGLIRQHRALSEKSALSAALHCVPLAPGRSRLLFRVVIEYPTLIQRIMSAVIPRWMVNLNSCRILEEDATLIASQEDALKLDTLNLGQRYFPIRSMDYFVWAHRHWLDLCSRGMPWALGAATPALPGDAIAIASPTGLAPQLDTFHRARAESRYDRHVRQSRVTRNALANFKKINTASGVIGVATALAAIALEPGAIKSRVLGTAAASAVTWALTALQITRFFVNYDRISELRRQHLA